jgi:3-oxoacyl-[acyl-carrier protein] reductase
MNKKLLTEKVAIITGASRGIGRDIALSFAKEGASLFLICLQDIDSLLKVQKEAEQIGANVKSMLGDVSSVEFCKSVYQEVVSSHHGADVLVNCAGMITRSSVEDMTIDEWHNVINVNLHGTFYMCRSFLPDMRKRRYGKVINITSQMAHTPHPSASPSYEVSKAGISALTKHLAYQYAKYNICINNIAPGSIDTDMPKSMSKRARQALRDSVPMKRLGECNEVANSALFLASNMSDYITGSTIHINGGSLML